jgi:protease-4
MDSGMGGRRLARELKRAREDRRVKAVVLRADSPGGDPMASDVVARELVATARRKPVLVSQGQVAASGGYWISLEAQRIVSSPVTVTGSIGVIAGHAWNDSLGRKLGLNYDGVKHGAHADLYQGIRLPLTSQPLPDRPLTEFERQRAERLIRDMYGEFVDRVAKARRLAPAYVDSVGQGRVWSGTRAQRLGLVDELGGLWDAMRLAKASAGLASDAPLAVDEVPQLGWFNLGALWPKLQLLGVGSDRGGDDVDEPTAGPDSGLRAFDAADEAGVGPDAERVFLGQLLRVPGRPLVLSEPLRIEAGGEISDRPTGR